MAKYLVHITDGENEITAISNDVNSANTALYNVIGGMVQAELDYFNQYKRFKCSNLPRVTPEYDYLEEPFTYIHVKPTYSIVNMLIERFKKEATIIVTPIPTENSTFYLTNKLGFVKPTEYVNKILY